MPQQLVGEFEYLSLKPQLKLFSVAETEVVRIPGRVFSDLTLRYPQVMRQLAVSLVEKAEINNFHLETVSQSKGEMMIATALTGFFNIEAWKQAEYTDENLKSPLTVPVAWSIALLRKYLACDKRTVRDGLLRLVDDNLIEIEWVDAQMSPVASITISDLRRFGTRAQNKVQEKTYFKLKILNPQKLDDYCIERANI